MEAKTKSLSLFQLILAAMLFLGIIWIYGPLLVGLLVWVACDEDFSYGLLLPLVSAYLIYLKLPELRRRPWRPSWIGLGILALGFSLYLAGELVTDTYLPYISFFVVLSGGVWLLGGWSIFRLLAFPILMLILMVPLPVFVIQQLTLPLQLISSRLAAEFLLALGIPLVRHGNVIDLGVRQLQVVAACSGLRYLLALLSLTIIYSYFCQRRPWKAALLIISILPITLVANALRVAAIGLFPVFQAGFWHGFSGWLIFVLCFGWLTLLNWAMNYWQPPNPAAAAPDRWEKRDSSRDGAVSSTPHLIAALLLVAIALPLIHRAALIYPVPLRQTLDNFPLQLGAWQGRHTAVDPVMVRATRATAYLNADYINPGHDSINLWIAYYADQRGGATVHSPFSCLTGAGWTVVESSSAEVAPGRPVKCLLMEQAGQRLVVYYWYIQRGRWLTSEYLNKLFIGYDRLAQNRSDGALVRLITPAPAASQLARPRLDAFAGLLVPVLPQFIPD
jgi:exosortase D (VPLPA-CTERM-specific)